MKFKNLLFGLFLISSLFLFSQCGIRTVSINTMRPAEITFPSYVNTLLLVDRTKFEKQAVNIIEGILTGEMPGEDKAGMENAMNSFQSTLMSSPRFQLKRANESLNGNSLTSVFPQALTWEKVEELCTKYATDAIVAIEIFDTDFILTDGKRRVKKQVDENGIKREIEVDEFYAQGVANAKIGFRMYDPKGKTIADQQLFTKTNTWQAVGNSKLDAIAHLISKTEATKYVGRLAGSDYAYKIAPMPVRLTREFYGKSKKAPQLSEGARKADVNDWKGAVGTWEAGLTTAAMKEAGRLSYNIAVGYEVLGDMDNAKRYASKSWVDYKNKKAREYSRMLDYRKVQESQAQQQMNNN